MTKLRDQAGEGCHMWGELKINKASLYVVRCRVLQRSSAAVLAVVMQQQKACWQSAQGSSAQAKLCTRTLLHSLLVQLGRLALLMALIHDADRGSQAPCRRLRAVSSKMRRTCTVWRRF